MQVTDDTINKLAELSRLQFTGEERDAIRADLQKIIAFVDQLNELDTSGVEPLVHITDSVNVLRDDVAEVHLTRQQALQNAPQKDSDFFKIPKVLKK
jgi:aspartyl-tRNA(Asn)/glutamyl-tRNA(Gln) amidotransferase subunit C